MTDKQTVKFGDICKEVKLTTKDPLGDGYKRYIGLEHLDSGSLKIKRWGMIAEDNPSFTRVFKKGHILFGKRRPYLKKAAIAEFDGICSSDIIVLSVEELDVLKLILVMDSFWQYAIKNSSGSLSPRTKFTSLKNFETTFTQNVAALSIITSKVEVIDSIHEEALQSLSKLTSSLFNEKMLFTLGELNGLRPQQRETPNGWLIKPIMDVFKVFSGGTPKRGVTDYWGGVIPWVKTGEINYSDISTAEEFITEEGLQNSSAKIAPKGSVLLAMYGQGVTRGRVALVSEDVAINQACLCIAHEEKIFCDYLYYYLKSNYADLREFGNETTQKNLSASIVKNLLVPLPPRSTMAKTAIALAKIEKLESEIAVLKESRQELISGLVNL
ncbi:TPA: restriction endonuclease subunit S [Vibrio campbellii]|nr:restriction endonuclease subunit S [Vibrio campbellii]